MGIRTGFARTTTLKEQLQGELRWHGGTEGQIQDFVLGGRGGGGGHIGIGMGACPSKLARVSGKAQEAPSSRPQNPSHWVFVFALLEIIKHVFTDTND